MMKLVKYQGENLLHFIDQVWEMFHPVENQCVDWLVEMKYYHQDLNQHLFNWQKCAACPLELGMYVLLEKMEASMGGGRMSSDYLRTPKTQNLNLILD